MTLGAVGHRHKGAACVAGLPLYREAPCSKRFARAFGDGIGYSPVGTGTGTGSGSGSGQVVPLGRTTTTARTTSRRAA